MCKSREFDHHAYFEHGMSPTDDEIRLRDSLNTQLPGKIIDCHVHASTEDSFDVNNMSDFTWGHMVSTYPVTTIEQSNRISDLMMPDIDIRKLRFAHAFRGIAHAAVNEYLVENSPEPDRVALFGISDTPEEVDYTISELDTAHYNGLKMYYSSGKEPVYNLYEYFPKDVLARAEQTDCPIILHLPNTIENSLVELERLSEAYPNLRVALAHVGVTWIDNENLDGVFARLSLYKNFAVDTSGVVDVNVIEKAIRHLGADRVMFGTDEPLNLLREQSYENPKLGPRIISDYPYHWVDKEEYDEFKDIVPTPQYSQLQQVDSLLAAIRKVARNPKHEQDIAQKIFHDNAYSFFGF